MSSGFDPCKQWLGIDALSLSDPWLVLGVARGETNPLAIVRAADAKLAILRAVPPGPLTLARDALVKRVEAARDELLSAASQAAQAAPAPLAPPPRPMFAPPPVPMAPPVPPVLAAAEPSPPVRLNRQPVAKQSSGSSAVVAVISLLAVVIASYFAYQVLESRKKKPNADKVAAVTKTPNKDEGKKARPAKQSDDSSDDSRGSRKPMRQPDEPSDPAEPEPESSGTDQRKPRPKPDDGDSPADVKMRTKPEPEAEPEPEVDPKPKPTSKPDSETPDEKPARGTRPEPESDPKPEPEPDSKPKPDSKPRGDEDGPGDEPEMRPKPKPVPPADSEPAPESTPPKPSPTAKPEPDSNDPAAAAAEVAKLLREAYGALRESEFDTAKAALKTALDKAGDDDKLTLRVNCFRQLTQYAEQLLGYRDQAFKAAMDGGIYELPSGKMLAVVEISDKELVYKEGVNKRIPIEEIPPSWLLAIVTKWFEAEDNPGNHVFLGVYHVLKDKPNLKAAESEWGLAAFGGENVSFLTPLLRDPLLQPKDDAGN